PGWPPPAQDRDSAMDCAFSALLGNFQSDCPGDLSNLLEPLPFLLRVTESQRCQGAQPTLRRGARRRRPALSPIPTEIAVNSLLLVRVARLSANNFAASPTRAGRYRRG